MTVEVRYKIEDLERIKLRMIVSMMNELPDNDKVDVLVALAQEVLGQVLTLAEQVLEPHQAAILRREVQQQ